jgi:hypothetical protein
MELFDPAGPDYLFSQPAGTRSFSIMYGSPRPDQVGPFAPFQTLLWTGHFFAGGTVLF